MVSEAHSRLHDMLAMLDSTSRTRWVEISRGCITWDSRYVHNSLSVLSRNSVGRGL